MKVFNIKSLAEENDGEYVLGLKDLKTHAVYLIYGTLNPGEGNRKLYPGKGHEEVLCVVQGEVEIKTSEENLSIKAGEALHLKEDDEFILKNNGEEIVIYALAGGHPPVTHS